MRNRIFLKLLGGYIVVILVATVLLDLALRQEWENSFLAQTQQSLQQKTRLFADRVAHKEPGESYAAIAAQESGDSQARATIIQQDGTVLADSEAEPDRMENHAQRPEFKAALSGQLGMSQRWSHTRGVYFLYVAVPIPGGAVRLAYPLTAIRDGTRAIRVQILLTSALVLLIAVVLAAILASGISRRLRKIARFADQIASGNLGARISETSQDEIGQLAAALDRTAQRLQRSFEEVERVEATRRDFVANVSHELKTPLTSIGGYAETLAESESAPQKREFLEIVRRNAERMSRLVEDLLTLAQMESGKSHLSFAPVPVADLLRDAVAGFHDMAAARDMRLEIGELVPRAVQADAEGIHQVFANLIENAVKYSGGTLIEIGAREIPGAIEFYVRDNGSGIPTQHLPRLFERFYRVDKARSRESGGTGLGLAIVKHLVGAHGGSVRAESVENSGSTFLFQLPIAGTSLPKPELVAD